MRRFLAFLVIIVVCAIGAIDLKPKRHGPVETQSEGFPRQLHDGAGETLTIEEAPTRIVSQTLATDEILLSICAPERIQGLSPFALDPRYSNIKDQALRIGKPTVQSSEEIVSLKPDLIFVASYSRAETVNQLKSAGARVLRIADFSSLDSIKSNILLVGRATGDDKRAEELVKGMEKEIDQIVSKIPVNTRGVRVLSYSTSQSTAAAGTLFDDILKKLKVTNVAAEKGLSGFPQISAEHIPLWQPDYILTGAEEGKSDEVRRRLLSNPAIASSEAGRRGRIIIIDNRTLLTVSQYVVNLVRTLSSHLWQLDSNPASTL
jgi:iron complex transport system substrate-binding protein